MSLSLISSDNPILHTKCVEVTDIKSQVLPYYMDMLQIINDNDALGISANQVGLNYRFFIFKWIFLRVAINPVVIRHGKEIFINKEGCLSYPLQTADVERFTVMDVEYTNLSGNKEVKTLKREAAFIFNHELDHLNGITIFDKKLTINDLLSINNKS